MHHLFLLFMLSSCSFFLSDQPKSAKGSHYYVNFSSQDWSPKQQNRSDYVFENNKDGRILLSNSFCDEFQEDSLEHLAAKTFRAVDSFKVLHGGPSKLANRDAYKLEASGLVDGVQVVLRVVNTRRNNCYFDFVSISALQNARFPDQDFEDFVNRVEFK
jgi:hypothetical protein